MSFDPRHVTRSRPIGDVFELGDITIGLSYFPTEIRSPIGGERVTCRGFRLTSSLGRTKISHSLEKQQLELSTHT